MPPTLARTLRSKNSIESMISIARTHAQREELAERDMALHWCADGMVAAAQAVTRVDGHLQLPALRRTREHIAVEYCRSVVMMKSDAA